jgi:cell division protein ZapA (FtsZ GTPase activity inhibitor)
MNRIKELCFQLVQEVSDVNEQVKADKLNVLTALVTMREVKEEVENVLALIKSYEEAHFEEIEQEAMKYPSGYMDFKISVRSGSRMFSFKHIPEWIQLEEKKKEVEKKYRNMYEAVESGLKFANVDENGQEMPLPEVTKGKPSLIVKHL